jgi:hypothetical protein
MGTRALRFRGSSSAISAFHSIDGNGYFISAQTGTIRIVLGVQGISTDTSLSTAFIEGNRAIIRKHLVLQTTLLGNDLDSILVLSGDTVKVIPNTFADINKNQTFGGSNTFSGSTTVNSALSVNTTSAGFLPPRMTTTQRTALTLVEGLTVYDTDLHKLYVYDGTAWQAAW